MDLESFHSLPSTKLSDLLTNLQLVLWQYISLYSQPTFHYIHMGPPF